jgi:hypothetical protein
LVTKSIPSDVDARFGEEFGVWDLGLRTWN